MTKETKKSHPSIKMMSQITASEGIVVNLEVINES